MKKLIFFCLLECLSTLHAQITGLGMRFHSDFQHFYRAKENMLVDDWFSTGGLGLYFLSYNNFGGVEVGANIHYKGTKGNFALPLVTQDFTKNPNQNTGLSAGEMDIRLGPKVGKVFYPQFGYSFGYRFQFANLTENVNINYEIRKIYMNLPVGMSIYLPTQFGNTGFGLFYVIGLTNTLLAEKSVQYKRETGRQNALRFQITVLFGQ